MNLVTTGFAFWFIAARWESLISFSLVKKKIEKYEQENKEEVQQNGKKMN